MSQKILVIGGVALGPKAACRAKRLMPEAEITLIDQEEIISYGGCGIPYFVSGGVADPEGLRALRPSTSSVRRPANTIPCTCPAASGGFRKSGIIL